MFRSFFPRPAIFFPSAVLWSVFSIAFWFAWGRDWGGRFPAETPLPVNASRFWSLTFLWFYGYFLIGAALFAGVWFLACPHPWQYWSVLGSALVIFLSYFVVEIGVALNAWYVPFYDLIQKALATPDSVGIAEFYHQVLVFLSIILISTVVGVMSSFFVSHYVFRWRTAMNEYYMAHWTQLRHIEGAAQRVQEDTMRFASMLEGLGASLINALMSLIAFLPVLISLSSHVKNLPLVGDIPYALVVVALVWSVAGTGVIALIGIMLPGLEFNNQRAEAAYRKELVYGEDYEERAQPLNIRALFVQVRKSYFRLYFHYTYFNLFRLFYMRVDSIFGLLMLFPAIVAGTLTLGVMTQITNVFDQVRSSFQYLIRSWSTIVELLSICKRLRAFEMTIDKQQ
ncbi:peptide antibiotic transporter SbmA [Brenneria tiliae]|uniref:Peptide antibiotic transporter SbmA n=1 Tax=Brenneria tiliae TaxID=2914984 RepID=A0ABT0MVM1_9GAMM|nr:peptide antibiotic transporter SbmA [Brenneria tiliae]MCL2893254.1 peptide antibiotic transporter SbmA [Brenneria tiliae]